MLQLDVKFDLAAKVKQQKETSADRTQELLSNNIPAILASPAVQENLEKAIAKQTIGESYYLSEVLCGSQIQKAIMELYRINPERYPGEVYLNFTDLSGNEWSMVITSDYKVMFSVLLAK